MARVRSHLTYANVVSTLALFILLGSGTAVAAKKIGAKQLKAGSVTTAKLKRNAVRTGKIRNGAVSGAKIRDGSVDGTKVVDASVTGADVNAPSTPFSRVVERIRGTVQLPLTNGTIYPFDNPTYFKPAGRADQMIGAIDVTFAASCTPPRAVQAYLMFDPQNPSVPNLDNVVGTALVQDTQAGEVRRRAEFSPLASVTNAMQDPADETDATHTLRIHVVAAICAAGSGITANGAGVDIVGTR